jgi:hypothetical protein
MTATFMENMSKQLLDDFNTFILTFSLGVVALVLSTYSFHINRARTSLSEQIKTSRDAWVRINEKYDLIIAIMRSEDKSAFTDDPWKMLRPLAWDIDYFAFLVIAGEIRDATLLSYYRPALSGYIEAIMRNYATPTIRHDLHEEFPNFDRLIEIWNIDAPDEE